MNETALATLLILLAMVPLPKRFKVITSDFELLNMNEYEQKAKIGPLIIFIFCSIMC